jgi:uncharacterized membrane protein
VSIARATLALFWLVGGAMHFLRPRFYHVIVPPPLDEHARAVTTRAAVAGTRAD